MYNLFRVHVVQSVSVEFRRIPQACDPGEGSHHERLNLYSLIIRQEIQLILLFQT